MFTLLSTVSELYCAYCASVYFISFSHDYSAILAAKLMVKLDLTKLDLNTTHNSSDNLPSCLQTSIIAQVLSAGEKGLRSLNVYSVKVILIQSM